MNLYDITFYFFAAITLVSGGVVVFSKNIIYSAFSLLFTFFGVAGIYALLFAEFAKSRKYKVVHTSLDAYLLELLAHRDRITTVLEPLMIIFLAVVVGFIVWSIVLPILQVGNV